MPEPTQRTPNIQGTKNALVCAVGFIIFWSLVTTVISFFTDKRVWDAIQIAGAVIGGLSVSGFFAILLFGRRATGKILLDCGAHPSRKMYFMFAALFTVNAVVAWFSDSSTSGVLRNACLFFGSLAAFWLLMASGRLQVRENGIWQYWSLLPWKRIDSYTWASECNLVLNVKGPLRFLHVGVLMVPPDRKQSVDDLLKQYCPVTSDRYRL